MPQRNLVTTRIPTIEDIQREVEDVTYPDSDGQPMAESDFQRTPLTYAVESLTLHFEDVDDCYVSGNMFIYYEEGNRQAVVAPDVFVVHGVEKYQRRVYKVWEERRVPDFVIEITSKSTRSNDKGLKQGLYAYLGVREYFLYDPTTDYLTPSLQGFRLVGGGLWDELPIRENVNGTLIMVSDVLRLELHIEPGNELRFFDPVHQRRLPNYGEANKQLDRANKQLDVVNEQLGVVNEQLEQERQAKQVAQTELAALYAKLRQLGIEP